MYLQSWKAHSPSRGALEKWSKRIKKFRNWSMLFYRGTPWRLPWRLCLTGAGAFRRPLGALTSFNARATVSGEISISIISRITATANRRYGPPAAPVRLPVDLRACRPKLSSYTEGKISATNHSFGGASHKGKPRGTPVWSGCSGATLAARESDFTLIASRRTLGDPITPQPLVPLQPPDRLAGRP